MGGIGYENELNNMPKTGRAAQSMAQALTRPRRRPGKGKVILLGAVIALVVLPITFTLKAAIHNTAPTIWVHYSLDGRLLAGETLESQSPVYTMSNCLNCYAPDANDRRYTV